jgi:hypothetical protein
METNTARKFNEEIVRRPNLFWTFVRRFRFPKFPPVLLDIVNRILQQLALFLPHTMSHDCEIQDCDQHRQSEQNETNHPENEESLWMQTQRFPKQRFARDKHRDGGAEE